MTHVLDGQHDLLELPPHAVLELLDVDSLGSLRIADHVRPDAAQLALRCRSEIVEFFAFAFLIFEIGRKVVLSPCQPLRVERGRIVVVSIATCLRTRSGSEREMRASIMVQDSPPPKS